MSSEIKYKCGLISEEVTVKIVERRRYTGSEAEKKLIKEVVEMLKEYKKDRRIHTRALAQMLRVYAFQFENLDKGDEI